MYLEQVITAENLTKRYGKLVAVDGIGFFVSKGECFGILGPNGAGKTSVMKMITCVSPVTDGLLSVLGMDVQKESRAIKRLLGVVPQENTLDPDLTVNQNLVAYTRYFNISRTIAVERIRVALELLQLLDKKDSYIDTLSGGMKRRLMIARALLNEPRLLVLDEPTTGLDPQGRRLVWDRIRSLKGQGITTVLSTHYMDEAYFLCDRLIIMDHGSILAEGTPGDLVERYAGHDVIEIRPQPGSRNSILATLSEKGVQHKDVGETIYVYADNGTALLESLPLDNAFVVQRTGSLEDVFTRLTGRTIEQEE